METEAIKFWNEEYGIESGSAPEFADWCTMIKNMGGAVDMKFLRAYVAGVISCFVSPSTSSSISPRCYQCLHDLNQFRRTNFAQFAIDQIINEVKKMGVKKESVCCCLHHLVVIHYPSTGFVGAHKTTLFLGFQSSSSFVQCRYCILIP
jgi:hypothetical protein